MNIAKTGTLILTSRGRWPGYTSISPGIFWNSRKMAAKMRLSVMNGRCANLYWSSTQRLSENEGIGIGKSGNAGRNISKKLKSQALS